MNEIIKLVTSLPPLGFAAMDQFHIPSVQENLGALMLEEPEGLTVEDTLPARVN